MNVDTLSPTLASLGRWCREIRKRLPERPIKLLLLFILHLVQYLIVLIQLVLHFV